MQPSFSLDRNRLPWMMMMMALCHLGSANPESRLRTSRQLWWIEGEVGIKHPVRASFGCGTGLTPVEISMTN